MRLYYYRLFTLQALLITGVIVVSLGVVCSLLTHSPILWQFAFGIFIVLLFLRYPYMLLLAWVLVNPWIGSPVSFLNGNHFLTDLIVPTLLLMFFVPLKQVFRIFPVIFLLLFFLLWILAGIAVAPLGHGTFLTFWVSALQYVTITVLAVVWATTRQQFLRLLDAMLLLSTLVVFYGFYGYITHQYLRYDPFTSVPRMLAIFGSAPALAMFLSIGIPLAVYRATTLQGYKRIIPLLAGGVLLVGVGLSYTRGAYIAIPCGLLCLLFLVPSRKVKFGLLSSVLALLIGVVLLATVGHVSLFSRFLNGDILTLDGRIYLWQAILAHFDPTQLLGKGLRSSDVLLAHLQVRDRYGVVGTVAHSIFLETLYEQGIIGLCLLLFLLGALLVGLVQGIRKTTGDHRLLFATALAIYISMLLQSIQSNDLLTDLTIGSYFWIAMALPFLVCRKATSPTTGSEPTWSALPETEVISNWGLLEKLSVELESRHLRICLVSLAFPPIVGGAEKQAERHAHHLSILGHEVLVVTLRHDKRWPRSEKEQGVHIVRVGGLYRRNGRLRIGKVGHFFSDIALFVKLMRLNRKYDVLHVFQAHFPAAVAAIVGHLTGKPVIVRIQGTGPDSAQRAQLVRGAALLLDTLPAEDADHLRIRFMDWAPGEGDITYLPYAGIGGKAVVNMLRRSRVAFHVLSTRSCTYLLSHGFPMQQIVCIPNGVDAELFQPIPEKQPDLATTERVITCVARLEYAKGIDVLLHSWYHLMNEKAEWGEELNPVLQIIGDGALREQMEWIASQLGIQSSVRFLGTRSDTLELLQRSWAFVLPSRWEGMPNALLEAMACGLPCVATRVSGSEDIVIDGVNGLLVEPEQPVALAEALRRLLTTRELIHRLREEARTTILRDYQLPFTVGLSLSFYRRLLVPARTSLSVPERSRP